MEITNHKPEVKKTVLITGGSGFIGTQITRELLKKGYSVIVVDKSAPKIRDNNLTFITCELSKESLPNKYDGLIFAVIHLAGKNIFGRWSSYFKKELYDSRILSMRSLVRTFSSWKEKPNVVISASAFGYYGDKKDSLVTEDFKQGEDFGALLCHDWEEEAKKNTTIGIRTVLVRTANVLGDGGLLATLLFPFRHKFGFYLGKGEGWFPWIHIEDIVALYIYAIENEKVSGPINAAGEEYVTQKEFMVHLSKITKTWVTISIPIFLLYIRFGEFALSFNNSVKMSSHKIESLGFVFTYKKLDKALTSIISK